MTVGARSSRFVASMIRMLDSGAASGATASQRPSSRTKRQRLIHQRRGTAIGFACGRRNQRNAAAGVCECQRSQRSGQSGTDNGNFKMLHGLRFPSTLSVEAAILAAAGCE